VLSVEVAGELGAEQTRCACIDGEVAIELLRRRLEQTAALGVGMDVDERAHVAREIEDAGRCVRICEVVLVPDGVELRGELLGLRAPALACIVRRPARKGEPPAVRGERAGHGRRDAGAPACAGDECRLHSGPI